MSNWQLRIIYYLLYFAVQIIITIMKFIFDKIAHFYIYNFKDKIEKKLWKKLILLGKVVFNRSEKL